MGEVFGVNGARFKDRDEAARTLAVVLAVYRGRRPLVLGIPRGGVRMADLLARELGGDLDVVLVRKLRAPGHPELAIGSVTEQGKVFLNEGWENFAPESYMKSEVGEAAELLRRRRQAYTPQRPPIPPTGRVTIVVDDGIATGATMIAALRSLKESGAARVVAAAAVAPSETLGALRKEADDVVCLATPDPFYAVSLYFENFSEVSDEEVLEILRRSPLGPAGEKPSIPLFHGNFGLHRTRHNP
jgi:predicted phosphoribosyltransferase